MKTYLWAALSLLFVVAGIMAFYLLFTKGHIESALGDRGVPFILDAGGAIIMLGLGGLGLKAFWDDITKKHSNNNDN